MKKIMLTLILFAGVQTFSQNYANNGQNQNLAAVLDEVNNITYIEKEEEVHLGFDTALYLPQGYNPNVYFSQNEVIEQITYIETEEKVNLFDGILSESELDFLKSIRFIENEEAVSVPSFSK